MIRRNVISGLGLIFVLMSLLSIQPTDAQLVMDGLVSYWSFDKNDVQGDIVKDLIGKNDGKIVNKVKVVEGKINQALLFEGAGYVEVPDDPSLKPQAFTIQFWVNSNKNFGATSRFELVDDTGQVVIRNDERGEFGSNLAFHWFDGSAWLAINPSFVPSPKKWYNIAAVHDGSEARLFVDGKLESSLSKKFAWSGGETGISIGAHKWASANFFDGMIDELLFYNRALKDTEIKKNFSASGLSVSRPVTNLPICWAKLKL